MTWRDRAACNGLPVAWFYPENRGEKPHPQAVRACARCPVRDDCLETALQEERHARWYASGYRGGMTPRKRRVVVVERQDEDWPDPYAEQHAADLEWIAEWKRNQPQPAGAMQEARRWTSLAARIRNSEAMAG